MRELRCAEVGSGLAAGSSAGGWKLWQEYRPLTCEPEALYFSHTFSFVFFRYFGKLKKKKHFKSTCRTGVKEMGRMGG